MLLSGECEGDRKSELKGRGFFQGRDEYQYSCTVLYASYQVRALCNPCHPDLSSGCEIQYEYSQLYLRKNGVRLGKNDPKYRLALIR